MILLFSKDALNFLFIKETLTIYHCVHKKAHGRDKGGRGHSGGLTGGTRGTTD